MKLDVFEVDEARAHAIRHRDAVADAAGLVGGVQENLPEAAGGKDGFLGDDGDGFAGDGVEHVGAEAGERLVFVGGVGGIVREREQVDGDPALAACNAGRGVHALRDAVEDGVAGGVLGEDDALLAVPALAGELEFAGGVAVEGDVEFVEQEFLHRGRALVDELRDGGGIRGVVAGFLDVLRERTGVGGRGGVVYNSALRPIAVGGEGFGEGKKFNRKSALGGFERIRRAREPGANHETVGAEGAH